MKREQEQEETEQLLPAQKRKYPTVVKWKVGSLVITIFITIFLITDILLLVEINKHEPRNINYTFSADILSKLENSAITVNQFANIMTALVNSYTDIWFQTANTVDQWHSTDTTGLTLSRTIDFFTTKVQNRLTMLQFKDSNNNNWVAAAYTHIPFKIPNTWKDYLVTQSKDYYTFQIDDRQSTIMGGSSNIYLKMNGSDANLVNCKIIDLTQFDLTFLEGVDLTLQSDQIVGSPYITFHDLGQTTTECFSTNAPTGATFFDWLKQSVGPTLASDNKYTITGITSFELLA